MLLALGVIATLSVHFGCVTSKPEMAWVRTDGKRIVDDPALLQQGKTDIAFCHANLDAGAVDEAFHVISSEHKRRPLHTTLQDISLRRTNRRCGPTREVRSHIRPPQ